MRVLEVAPFASPIDERRRQLGGAQVLFADLARGLARRGHEVVLAAADGSYVSGTTLAPLGIDSRRMRPAELGATEGERADDEAQRDAFARVRAWADTHRDEIDVVHAHAYDAPAFSELAGAARPVVHTLHLPPLDRRVVAAAREAAADATLVTVSSTNARAWRDAGVDVRIVIANGIDLSTAPREASRGTHLVCAGRVSPEKGVADAIEVARRVGRGIVVIGGVYDDAYFRSAVEPHVRHELEWQPGDAVDGAIYAGARTRQEVLRTMAGAAATVMPIHWDEPFGLVAAEAQLAGCPVVGFRRGALPEVVEDGRGGYLVDPDDERALVPAIDRARRLDRARVRTRAMRAFSMDACVERYVSALQRVARS